AWAGYLSPIDERSLLVPTKPQPANRPGIDKLALLQEFQRRCEQESVDINCQGWRLREAEYLARWYRATHPGAPALRTEEALQKRSETIRRRLKDAFDAYERTMRADLLPDEV